MAGKAIDPSIYDGLDEFATVRQLEYLAAVRDKRSIYGAAKVCKVHPNVVKNSLKLLQTKAAKSTAAQHQDVNRIPAGFAIKGTSTLSKTPDGGLQWVKTERDKEQQAAALEEAVRVLAQECRGLAPIVEGPQHASDDLMCVIPVGDPHFGLYVWAQECGQDFDTDIARKLSEAAVDRLVSSAPNCAVGILLLLGDILHANDQTNQTPAHRHQLDVDTRFVRVVGITVQTWRYALLRMKQKFKKVVGKLVPGNHDPTAVWALAYALAAYFESDPSIEIDLGPSKFWYYAFGDVLIGSTHGDTVKPERLPGIMAADRPLEWGKAKHRYWYTGHIHSKNAIEFPGVQWESFRTLAPADSYASSHGYRAGRDMVAIVHHRRHGEVERHRVDAGMVQ